MWWIELMNILCLLQTHRQSEKSEVYMMKEYVGEVSNGKEIKARVDQL